MKSHPIHDIFRKKRNEAYPPRCIVSGEICLLFLERQHWRSVQSLGYGRFTSLVSLSPEKSRKTASFIDQTNHHQELSPFKLSPSIGVMILRGCALYGSPRRSCGVSRWLSSSLDRLDALSLALSLPRYTHTAHQPVARAQGNSDLPEGWVDADYQIGSS